MSDIVGKLPGWLPRRLWMLAHECDLVSPRDFIDACIHGSVVAAADALRQAAERIKELERERQEAADEIERLREENERLRKALIKVCDRAHKLQVGCPSESFDIAIKEAKLMLNDTMPLAPFPNEPPFPSTTDSR